MKATEGKIGRVFIIRLEDGDVIPTCIEEFAKENGIAAVLERKLPSRDGRGNYGLFVQA